MGTFIDLNKAINIADHGILFNGIDAYGIRGVSGDFQRAYTSNRSLNSFIWVQVHYLTKKLLHVPQMFPIGLNIVLFADDVFYRIVFQVSLLPSKLRHNPIEEN